MPLDQPASSILLREVQPRESQKGPDDPDGAIDTGDHERQELELG